MGKAQEYIGNCPRNVINPCKAVVFKLGYTAGSLKANDGVVPSSLMVAPLVCFIVHDSKELSCRTTQARMLRADKDFSKSREGRTDAGLRSGVMEGRVSSVEKNRTQR